MLIQFEVMRQRQHRLEEELAEKAKVYLSITLTVPLMLCITIVDHKSAATENYGHQEGAAIAKGFSRQ